MKELLSIYKKQSVVERNWRCLKDKRLLVNTLYLESPSRINALMWGYDFSSFNLFCNRIPDEKEDGRAKAYSSYT